VTGLSHARTGRHDWLQETIGGIFEQITELLGGREPLERFASDQAQFEDPNSPDHERWKQMVGTAPPEDL